MTELTTGELGYSRHMVVLPDEYVSLLPHCARKSHRVNGRHDRLVFSRHPHSSLPNPRRSAPI